MQYDQEKQVCEPEPAVYEPTTSVCGPEPDAQSTIGNAAVQEQMKAAQGDSGWDLGSATKAGSGVLGGLKGIAEAAGMGKTLDEAAKPFVYDPSAEDKPSLSGTFYDEQGNPTTLEKGTTSALGVLDKVGKVASGGVDAAKGIGQIDKAQDGYDTTKGALTTAGGVGGMISGIAGLFGKDGEAIGGAAGALGGIAKSGVGIAQGVEKMAGAQDGWDRLDGLSTVAQSGAGMAAAAYGGLGNTAAAGQFGGLAGAAKAGVGLVELAGGLFGDDQPAPGQSTKDNADLVLNGIDHLLHGGADAAAGLGPVGSTVAAVGKAASAGLAVGDALAPVVFGKMDGTGAKFEDVPADGEFKPKFGGIVGTVASWFEDKPAQGGAGGGGGGTGASSAGGGGGAGGAPG